MGRYVDIVTQNKWNQALMDHSNDWITMNANYALTKISENKPSMRSNHMIYSNNETEN